MFWPPPGKLWCKKKHSCLSTPFFWNSVSSQWRLFPDQILKQKWEWFPMNGRDRISILIVFGSSCSCSSLLPSSLVRHFTFCQLCSSVLLFLLFILKLPLHVSLPVSLSVSVALLLFPLVFLASLFALAFFSEIRLFLSRFSIPLYLQPITS